MDIEDLDEPISVRADFTSGQIKPRMFRRGRQVFKVETLNAQWIDREGHHANYYFSVQAGADTYFLCMKSDDMSWWLQKVIVGGGQPPHVADPGPPRYRGRRP